MSKMAGLENHKEEVPLAHYREKFAQTAPEEISARLKNAARKNGKFYVNLLGTEYAVSHPECSIRAGEGKGTVGAGLQIFLLRYLVEGKAAAWLGTWKTFREMPWGAVYQVPFSGRILSRAAFTFGIRPDAFRRACEKLGGIPLDQADAAYEFPFLDNYRLRILIWEGDEEFPPSAQILYSDNFAAGFTAEDRVIAAELLIGAIKSNMERNIRRTQL